MKFITKLKNWWNPRGYEQGVIINLYNFSPKEDITAYELYLLKEPIPGNYPTPISYQSAIDRWYKNLPDNCKRHLIPLKTRVVFMYHYFD
jgi:hypothetical protein